MKKILLFLLILSLTIMGCSDEKENPVEPVKETDPFVNATFEFISINGNTITSTTSITISTSDDTKWPVISIKGTFKSITAPDSENEPTFEQSSCYINNSKHVNYSYNETGGTDGSFTITNPVFLEGNNSIKLSLSKGDFSKTLSGTLVVTQ